MSLDDLESSTLRDLPLEPVDMGFDRPAGYDEPELYDAAIEPVDGLVGREVDTPGDELDEFKVETSEDIVLNSSGGSEFQVPDASQELFATGSRGRRGPFEEDSPVGSRAAPGTPAAEPFAAVEQPSAQSAPSEPVEPVRRPSRSCRRSPPSYPSRLRPVFRSRCRPTPRRPSSDSRSQRHRARCRSNRMEAISRPARWPRPGTRRPRRPVETR